MSKDYFGRKLVSLGEAYSRIYYGFRNMPVLKKSIRSNYISESFKERIMIAVTEVNGCSMCSYAHATMALEAGLNQNEIDDLIGGITENVPSEERQGILFGQHIADNRGVVSKKVWNQIIETYGKDEADGILASSQVIMLGNAYGIPFGSLMRRITKNEKYEIDERSSIGYEIMMILSIIVFLPVGLIHSLIGSLLNLPLAKFKDE
ncbi:MAG: carboxymuconolactone decarboxylase family protein [Tissierellia bacterium]|nr:carboxymuconolactone decarboxylase family protein [Tissierellia bacterium]